MKYVIRFTFPEQTCYAGLHKGAMGFAPRLDTAELYETRTAALRTLANGYSSETAAYGEVVEL